MPVFSIFLSPVYLEKCLIFWLLIPCVFPLFGIPVLPVIELDFLFLLYCVFAFLDLCDPAKQLNEMLQSEREGACE